MPVLAEIVYLQQLMLQQENSNARFTPQAWAACVQRRSSAYAEQE